MLEIESTNLVKELPKNLDLYNHEPIRQGYLSLPPSPLRIRQKGEKFELTKKFPVEGQDFSTAEEITILLTADEFNKLWPLVERSLEKVRYKIPLTEGLVAELDIFLGRLKGLAMVEVEYQSKEQMLAFKKPEWFGRDITREEFSANSFLAGKSFEEIKRFIEK
jgi:adenylate cyclase